MTEQNLNLEEITNRYLVTAKEADVQTADAEIMQAIIEIANGDEEVRQGLIRAAAEMLRNKLNINTAEPVEAVEENLEEDGE